MPEKREYKYFAFISYSRRDEAFARRLHRFLTGFNLPSHLCKQHPDKPKNLRPIYRDKTNLGTGNLSKGLSGGLEESKYIVVICSKNSARPNRQGKNWINTEVRSFVALQEGNEDYVIPVLLRKKGEPSAECTPEAVQELHLLAADVSDKGEQRVFSDVAAKMLGLSPDDLWNWWGRVLRRRRIIRWTMSSIATIAAAYTGWWCWDYYTPHYSYFTDYVEFNNIPHGLNPLTEEETKSIQSHYKFTTHRHKLRSVQNLNSVGRPITTSFYPLHEDRPVSMTLAYDDTTGDVKEQIFYDQFNREVLAKRFPDNSTITYHSIRKDRNVDSEKNEIADNGIKGANFSLGFFDKKGDSRKKKLNIERYHLTRDENGAITDISYRNVYNKIIEDEYGICGEHIERDSAGRIIKITTVNREGKPAIGEGNVVHTLYEYNDDGEVKSKTYLGRIDQKVIGADGYASVHYLWENRNLCQSSFYDNKDAPTLDANGVSIIRLKYDDKGMQIYKGYFNQQGEPCKDKEFGISSIATKCDERGNIASVISYNERGEIMASDSFAETRIKYNEIGEPISVSFYDTKGSPCIVKGEGSRIDYEYDEYGHEISTTTYDESGNMYAGTRGFARTEKKYDDRGNMVYLALFDTQGEGYLDTEMGFSSIKMSYDDRGNTTSIAFFGKNGEEINGSDGFHKMEAEYDQNGKEISHKLYDKDGKALSSAGSYTGKGVKHAPSSISSGSKQVDLSEISKDLHVELSRGGLGSTPPPYSEATLEWAMKGNVGAQYIIAQCYAAGSGVPKDVNEAIKWYDKAAEQGMPIARIYIAWHYHTGDGVEKNVKEAIKIYKQLIADSENDNMIGNSMAYGAAMNNLGVCYERGDGVDADEKLALELYEEGAKLGDFAAGCNAGRLYFKAENMFMALYYYKAASYMNDTARKMAKLLEPYGKDGYISSPKKPTSTSPTSTSPQKPRVDVAKIGRDLEAALSDLSTTGAFGRYSPHLLKMAETGHPGSQWIIATSYAQGRGIDKNVNEAIKWYGKAAQQGNLMAELMIAWYYHTGDGVEKNIKESIKIYQKLVSKSETSTQSGEAHIYAAAMNNLGVCYEQGNGINESIEEAIELYKRAAEQGDMAAHFNLGRCYLIGNGVARNVEKAKLHFKQAYNNKKSAEVLKALR